MEYKWNSKYEEEQIELKKEYDNQIKVYEDYIKERNAKIKSLQGLEFKVMDDIRVGKKILEKITKQKNDMDERPKIGDWVTIVDLSWWANPSDRWYDKAEIPMELRKTENYSINIPSNILFIVVAIYDGIFFIRSTYKDGNYLLTFQPKGLQISDEKGE